MVNVFAFATGLRVMFYKGESLKERPFHHVGHDVNRIYPDWMAYAFAGGILLALLGSIASFGSAMLGNEIALIVSALLLLLGLGLLYFVVAKAEICKGNEIYAFTSDQASH